MSETGHSKGPHLRFEAAETSQGQGITIHEITPGPKTSVEHPCFTGKHRWAYLTNGRVACGYCGTPR